MEDVGSAGSYWGMGCSKEGFARIHGQSTRDEVGAEASQSSFPGMTLFLLNPGMVA